LSDRRLMPHSSSPKPKTPKAVTSPRTPSLPSVARGEPGASATVYRCANRLVYCPKNPRLHDFSRNRCKSMRCKTLRMATVPWLTSTTDCSASAVWRAIRSGDGVAVATVPPSIKSLPERVAEVGDNVMHVPNQSSLTPFRSPYLPIQTSRKKPMEPAKISNCATRTA